MEQSVLQTNHSVQCSTHHQLAQEPGEGINFAKMRCKEMWLGPNIPGSLLPLPGILVPANAASTKEIGSTSVQQSACASFLTGKRFGRKGKNTRTNPQSSKGRPRTIRLLRNQWHEAMHAAVMSGMMLSNFPQWYPLMLPDTRIEMQRDSAVAQ